MPGITAILHTKNDELRIARAVESLRPCDEVLVVDHGSSDETRAVAQRFGARVVETSSGKFDTQPHVAEAQHDWIFCMTPAESLSEGLESSLLEWKCASHAVEAVFTVSVLEEIAGGWAPTRMEPRLAHRASAKWSGWKLLAEHDLDPLDGDLLLLKLP